MRSLLPLLLLGLAGCYSSGPRSPSPEEYTPSLYGNGWYSEPLRASIWFDEHSGFASFEVNRSAHVAVFALQPGGSMQMIYPAIGFGGRQQFAGGRHQIHTAAPTYRRGSPYHNAGFYNHRLGNGFAPTYIIMIASERPLDTRRFLATGTDPWLNRVAATWNPYTATEVLASEIVPRPSVTDWTVAYHVIWPDGMRDGRYYQPRYTWVTCPGNVILSVPIEAVRRGLVYCPTSQTPVGDTTGVDAPLPKVGDAIARRPVPPGWMGPAETDEANMRETLRRVAERRGIPEGEMETPLPAWRRTRVERPGRGGAEGPSTSERRQRAEGWQVPTGRPAIPVSRPSAPEARPAAPRPTPSSAEPARRVERRPRPSAGERPSQPVRSPTPHRQSAERASRPSPPPRASSRPPARPKTPPKPKPKPKENGGGGGGSPGAP